ncbi:hypothetical protein [Candidatus Paracaedibacter symbiosus]|uniref:hypothetical protein n=1 Tax=Candidatus Paracaedibacter symbiosus TaxID=244582 RepID=UPI000509AB13|nr:hypothetical protein [Candidatus Paracaedibacter symbiosus]
MKFHQNFNKLSIRPYGQGYQAPSTALFNTEVTAIQIAPTEEDIETVELVQMPDFIEVLVDIVSVPLPQESFMATYQFDDVIWPSVPLYPLDEPQFVRALKLMYGGRLKIRDNEMHESVPIRGKNIKGFEVVVDENESVYTHKFDVQNSSIDFYVKQIRDVVPIWSCGGFYRPSLALDQIQQVFCSISEYNGKTLARKTLLHQWNDQGFYPPFTAEKDNQKTIFKTNHQELYVKFIDTICRGEAVLKLINPQSNEATASFIYRSVDIKEAGIGKAYLHFQLIS